MKYDCNFTIINVKKTIKFFVITARGNGNGKDSWSVNCVVAFVDLF